MANQIVHGVTTANAVASISLAQAWPTVTVVNRGGGGLFVRADGVAPTVNGDDNWVVPVNSSITIPVTSNMSWEPGSGQPRPSGTSVQVIAGVAVTYSVVGTPA